MIVEVSNKLDDPADLVWKKVKQSNTLRFVTRGMLSFDKTSFPVECIEEKTIETKLYLFGFLPLWKHQLYFVKIDDESGELQTKEKGGIISVWNHRIKVQKLENHCLYKDQVQIKAGIITRLVWLINPSC